MTESVQTDVLHYELIRSRRKTVGLSLDQTGKLTVRAPLSLRREAIDEIVSSHRDWITRHRAAIDALPPPFVLREGASLSILGKPRIVRFRHADAIQLLEDQLILPSGTADADLTAWLRAMALSVVQSRVDVFAAQMGLSPHGRLRHRCAGTLGLLFPAQPPFFRLAHPLLHAGGAGLRRRPRAGTHPVQKPRR